MAGGWIQTLSQTQLVCCFTFLDMQDLVAAAKLNSNLFRASKTDSLWRDLYLQRWHFGNQAGSSLGLRLYIQRHMIEKGQQQGRAGQYEVKTCRGHSNYISSVKLCGPTLATASFDQTVQVYDCKEGGRQPLLKLEFEKAPTAMDYDGDTIVVADDDGQIFTWKKQTESEPYKLLGKHTGGVTAMVLDGVHLYTGGNNGTLLVWSLLDMSTVCNLPSHNSKITQIRRLPNGKLLSMSSCALKVWHSESKQLLGETSGSAILVDTGGNALPLFFGGYGTSGASAGVHCLTTQDHIVLVANSGTLEEYEIPDTPKEGRVVSPQPMTSVLLTRRQNGRRSNYTNSQRGISAADCSKQELVLGEENGMLRVYEYSTLRMKYQWQAHDDRIRVNSVKIDAFKVLSAGADLSIKVYDLKTGAALYTLLGGSIKLNRESPPHPQLQGCYFLDYDDTKIIVTMASIVRIYDFALEASF